MKCIPWTTLAIAALAPPLSLIPRAASLAEMDRGLLSQGEIWRLLTGHLTHFTASHLAWDVAAFVMLGTLAEPLGRVRLALVALSSAIACSLSVIVLLPGMQCYRGLSGVDCALFGMVAVDALRAGLAGHRRLPVLLAAAALAGFSVKVAWELSTSTALFAASGSTFVPVPAAHLAGLCVGILGCFAPWGRPACGRRDAHVCDAPDATASRTAAAGNGR